MKKYLITPFLPLFFVFPGIFSLSAANEISEELSGTPFGFNIPAAPACTESIEWSGYLDAGLLCNTYGADSNGNVFTGSESGGRFSGAYLRAKKTAKFDSGLDWGFGVDFGFGEETRAMRTVCGFDQDWYTGHDRFGAPTYGFAMPQLYGEAALGKWRVDFGHFYTTLGYEGLPATDRFFYSSGLSYDSLPSTHTGVLFSYAGFDKLEMRGGWVNGTDDGFTDELGGSMFLAYFKYTLSEQCALVYSFLVGDLEDYTAASPRGPVFRRHQYGSYHSWFADVKLGEDWNAVTTVDYQDLRDIECAHTTVFGQHLYRTFSDRLRLGARIEWEKTSYAGIDEELFDMTFGANWKPCGLKYLLIRPEIRYDHSLQSVYDDGSKQDQLCLGGDVLLSF